MTPAERIAQQRARMAQRAAVKPAPLKRDKVLPKPKRANMQAFIDAFVADRAYEEVRRQKDADGNTIAVISRDRVNSMADIFAILTKEQPDEYIHASKDSGKGKSYRTMGMEDIEIPDIPVQQDEYDRDLIVSSGEELRTEEDEVKPLNVRRVVAEVIDENPPSPKPTAVRPFAPPPPAQNHVVHADNAVPPPPAANPMQARMLEAMRSQRRQNLELMDE